MYSTRRLRKRSGTRKLRKHNKGGAKKLTSSVRASKARTAAYKKGERKYNQSFKKLDSAQRQYLKLQEKLIIAESKVNAAESKVNTMNNTLLQDRDILAGLKMQL